MAASYLQKEKFRGKAYVVGTHEGIGQELKNAGISYIGPGPDPVADKPWDISTALGKL